MKKRDIVLCSLLLAFGLLALLWLMLGRETGQRVQIRVDGEVVKTMDLTQAAEYDIPLPEGMENRVVIRDGKAWMETANCPDGLCQKMGRVSAAGESIICLPHHVVVEVLGEASVDAVAGQEAR